VRGLRVGAGSESGEFFTDLDVALVGGHHETRVRERGNLALTASTSSGTA